MSLKVLLNFKLNWVLLCASFWLFALPIQAKYVVAVVGKTKNDSFYQQAFKGCEQFAKQHLDFECIYDGPKDFQDIRTQVLVITDLVRRNNISGLLIATTDSNYLVERALKKLKDNNIPVITFDSDLLEKDQQYRLTYVGTNNFDYGVALGNELKKFTNKENNQVCIQSGHSTTPNLNKRIEGVRYALSGQKDKRLSGENGWSEFDRCPLI
ncbi:MAG: substrate-binding domain-containing protein [Pseudomonadota bacterium]